MLAERWRVPLVKDCVRGLLWYNNPYMAAKRTQIQIDVPDAVRNRAKALAYGRGQSLTELMLQSLISIGDKELTELIEKDLRERAQRGRPSKED